MEADKLDDLPEELQLERAQPLGGGYCECVRDYRPLHEEAVDELPCRPLRPGARAQREHERSAHRLRGSSSAAVRPQVREDEHAGGDALAREVVRPEPHEQPPRAALHTTGRRRRCAAPQNQEAREEEAREELAAEVVVVMCCRMVVSTRRVRQYSY